MNITEKYALEIQTIKQLINQLKNGQIYEIDSVPGLPKCNTIGEKLEKEFDLLLKKIETERSGKIELAAQLLSNKQ